MSKINFLQYCQPHDIVLRLARSKRHWFHGKPKIYLKPFNKRFSSLEFDFGDQKIVYRIYLKDREAILDSAHYAIENFTEIYKNYKNYDR